MRDALCPGGSAVVVDTMPVDADDLAAQLQSLHLALRTDGGGVHVRASYTSWLEDAGFAVGETLALGSLTAMVARSRG